MKRPKPSLFLFAVVLALLSSPVFVSRVRADATDEILKAQAQRVEVIRRARSATICIFGRGGRGGGSGVVISPDGFALTNFHVTNGAGTAMKVGMADGTLYDAVIVGIDPVGDVALIKLVGRDDFPFAPMADSDKVRQLDPCFAAGNPFLLATDFQPTITYGIVSGVHRYQYPAGTILEYADCIQTDASINPGNSGGPLFNLRGEIIGINGRGSFEKRGRVNVGVGYAISINQIKNFLGYLKSGRIVDHATLGAQVYTDDEGRVRVSNILESSDAYRRGMRYGDELARFGGRFIHTANGFKNALGIYPRDWRVPMTFSRDGTSYDVHVRLAGVHRKGELAEKIKKSGSKKPKPEPGDKPKPGPKLPLPKLIPGKAESAMPDEVKKIYEARPGYMNYYFNRIAQERIWKGMIARGDFTGLKGTWSLVTEGPGGLPASFILADDQVVAALPGGKVTMPLDAADPQFKDLRPPGSGGQLVAMYMWRRFLLHGIEQFGGIYYVGQMPIPGHEGLVDCLSGVYGGIENRFLFDPATGHLLAVETYLSDLTDPAEIHFSDYADRDGRQLPGKIRVLHGDTYDQAYKVTRAALAAAE